MVFLQKYVGTYGTAGLKQVKTFKILC